MSATYTTGRDVCSNLTLADLAKTVGELLNTMPDRYEFRYHPAAMRFKRFQQLERDNVQRNPLRFNSIPFLIPMVPDETMPEHILAIVRISRTGPVLDCVMDLRDEAERDQTAYDVLRSAFESVRSAAN